ncbi:MAG: general stress protein [Verrucomicrobiaceae bacterium]|nr:MAG: general stress protein [Verrucomicrobiaceae bacterium]
MIANYPSEAQKFHDLLEKFGTAMLVTHSSQGELRARPMAIAKIDEDCSVWFLSLHESGKVHEIETAPNVAVTCQKDRDIYLSLSGTAVLSRDRAKIEELWDESYKVWFPKGKDDPDLVLIGVEPHEGEYWDQEGTNKLQYLFQAAKAYATGTRPKIEEGEQHGKTRL